jgi:hypothetical protein
VKRIDDKSCEFTNTVHSSATPELIEFLGKRGIPWEVTRAEHSKYPRLIHFNKLPMGGPLRGLGRADALFRRGSRGLQLAAVGFFTREEQMRHA